MEFELQYELDEFKLIQDQYFDEDNKCYTGVNLSTDIMEKMLSLIDNLSERVNELEPVIKQQIKKSLPIHDVMPQLLCLFDDMYQSITKGKKYKLVFEAKNLYYFIDNKGEMNWKNKDWFKVLPAQ